jgi:hypothetical protein
MNIPTHCEGSIGEILVSGVTRGEIASLVGIRSSFLKT